MDEILEFLNSECINGEITRDGDKLHWYYYDFSEDADILYDAYTDDANALNKIGIKIKDNWQDNDSCGFEIIVPKCGFKLENINNPIPKDLN